MALTTRQLTPDELEDLGVPNEMDRARVISDTRVDTRRWYEIRRFIWRGLDGRLWGVDYQRGLTEMQEDHPLWGAHEPGSVTVTLMEAYTVPVLKYRPVGSVEG